MSDNKRIAKNTVFLYFRMFLIMSVSLFTSRIILKVLGETDFGIYNVVGGIVMMFTFMNGALAGATSRFITFEIGRKDDIQLRKVFNVSFVTHIFIALIVLVLAETIGLWFLYNKMIIPVERMDAAFWVYQISIATCMLSITQVPYTATIIAHENMGIYAYVGIIEALIKLGIVYLIMFSPADKLIAYAILMFLTQAFIMLFYRFYSNRHYTECRLKLVREWKIYKNMFVYATSDMIGNLSVLAQGQGLNMLLNMFFGPAVNAARGIAYQIQGAVTQFSGNFMTAVKPQIIKLYALGKTDDMMELVAQSSCLSYYMMLLLVAPICLEADYILTIWLSEYPDYTVSFLRLALILCMIQTIKTPRTTVFHATGKILLPNTVVGAILCLALPAAYIVLKLGGDPNSVFWTAIVSMILSEIAGILLLKKLIINSVGSYTIRVHLRCAIITVAALIIPILTNDEIELEGFAKLVATTTLTTICILTVVYTIGIDRKLRIKVNNIIRNKIFKNG